MTHLKELSVPGLLCKSLGEHFIMLRNRLANLFMIQILKIICLPPGKLKGIDFVSLGRRRYETNAFIAARKIVCRRL